MTGDYPCIDFQCPGCTHSLVSERRLAGFPFQLVDRLQDNIFKGEFHQGHAAFKFVPVDNQQRQQTVDSYIERILNGTNKPYGFLFVEMVFIIHRCLFYSAIVSIVASHKCNLQSNQFYLTWILNLQEGNNRDFNFTIDSLATNLLTATKRHGRPKTILTNQLKRMKRPMSLLKTRIIEFDPVLNAIVRFSGFRFARQLGFGKDRTIIWKGFECFTVKRSLDGLEMISDEDLVGMEHSVNDDLQPMHQYIQIVDKQKFIVFLYRMHSRSYVHINGIDKKIDRCEMAHNFRVDGRLYKYENHSWTLL